MDYLTTGKIANKLNVDLRAVDYAIRRLKIKPVGRVGIVRLFPNDIVPAVRKYLRKKRKQKSAFTIIELLTVMSIIIILIGIMTSSMAAVRKYSRKVAQRGMFHDIGKGMEMFSVDFDGYPDSSYTDSFGVPYCGAMKLCEAMAGQDGLGFHPDSAFDATDGAQLYFNRPSNPLTDPPSLVQEKNLRNRKLYLEGNIQVADINDIFSYQSTFDDYCPVICDVFKKNQLRVAGEKAGMPILYYRASPLKILHDIKELTLPYDGGKNTYNYGDNYDIIELGVPWSNEIHPFKEPPSAKAEGETFYDRTRNKNVVPMDKPYNPNSYILISAGHDGLYGTEDDVFNFER